MSQPSKAKINGCLCKKRYPTREYANMVASVEHEKRGVNLRVYNCGFCHAFHLTRKPKFYS